MPAPGGQEGRTYPLVDHPLLRVRAFVQSGRIGITARGLLSYLPPVREALDMLQGQLPAQVGNRLYISTWFPPVPSSAFERLAKSQVEAAFGIRTPDQVTISITEECPNRCQHCALPDSGNRHRLPAEEAVSLIHQALDLGTTLIIFDGGEPTLYRELPQLVATVDSRAVSTMFTSGAGFTLPLARELKKAGLQAVNVSLDSPVPQEHDEMRGRVGAFQDAMNAIHYSLETGLLVDIYAVLRRDNLHHLAAFHRLAEEKGASELTFFEVVPTGRWQDRRDMVLSPRDRSELAAFVAQAPSPRIFSVPAALQRFGCFAARSWMHITPQGEVYPCACYPQSWGNALQEPLSRIWKRMSRFPYRGKSICPLRGR